MKELMQLSGQNGLPVKPVRGTKEEQQLNVWIPRDLMKRLKVRGVETDKSLKEMVVNALQSFL